MPTTLRAFDCAATAAIVLVGGLVPLLFGPWALVAAVAICMVGIAVRYLDLWQAWAMLLVAVLILARSQHGPEDPQTLIMASAVCLFVATVASARRRPQLPSPLLVERRFFLALAGFTAFSLASATWSTVPLRSLLHGGSLALICGIAWHARRGRWGDVDSIDRDASIILGVLGVSVVASGLAFVFGFGLPLGGPNDRLMGIYENPNTLATAAALHAPWLASRWRAERSNRWFFATGGAVLIVVLLLTQSRGATVAAGVGITVALLRGRVRGRVTGIALVVVGLAVLASSVIGPETLPAPVERVIERFKIEDARGSYLGPRQAAWLEGLSLWRERPVLGHGFRSGEELFQRQRNVGDLVFRANTTHNAYLQTLLELGASGFALLVGLMLITLWPYRTQVSRTTAGLHGVVVTGWSMQLTESQIFGMGSVLAVVFWLCAGMLVRSVALSLRSPPQAGNAGLSRGAEQWA